MKEIPKKDHRRVVDYVLTIPVDVISWDVILEIIYKWSCNKKSRVVCLCNVHSIVTARQTASLRKALVEADIVAPDGAPVAWVLRKLGYRSQERINGPDLMWKYCNYAQSTNQSIFLYGCTKEVLNALKEKLLIVYPNLKVAGAIAPPFRPLTTEEDASAVAEINNSGAGVVFVSLGCPKQELWMADHSGRINAVMIGVGAAFEYHAGVIKRAPAWMQDHGLEWMHRLATEPARLWKRYLVTNTLFLLGLIHQFITK